MKILLLTALLSTIIGAALHASTIVGDRVQIRREIPATGFHTGPFTKIVVNGPSDTVSISTGNNTYVNPESNSILFIFGPEGGAGGEFDDHVIVVSGIHWFGEPSLSLAAVTATSDMPGFSPSLVTFDAHSVTLAIGSFVWPGGQSVRVVLHARDPASFAGDYNPDGIVDAADYIAWRNGLGTTYTQADYDLWRTNFGQTAASVATAGLAGSASPAVPEPLAAALLVIATFGLLVGPRHRLPDKRRWKQRSRDDACGMTDR